MQVRVHPGAQHAHPAEPVRFGGVGVVGEGARDQQVEAGVPGLARRGHEVRPRHGAELRADQDAGAALLVALQEPALGAEELAAPAGEAGEGDAVRLAGLLPCRSWC